MAFNSDDEVSGNYVYSQIINEIKNAVFYDDLDKFKILSALLNYANIHINCETVRNYRQTAYESNGNINLITLACKSCALNLLKYLFSDDNSLYNLPFPIDKSALLPEEDDEQHHNAFYYAIRSNNSHLLKILIDKWPNDCFEKNSDKLDDILSKAYKCLIARNVQICKRMEICVKSKLVDLRFFQENAVQKKTVTQLDAQNLKDLTMLRIDFVLENIAYVRQHFWDSEPNELFILAAEYIAKNIHTLKSAIVSTHKLLWEEIEFCLIIFIRSCHGCFQTDPLYHFLLNKQRVLTHLENVSDVLITVKEQVKTGRVNKFLKIVIKGIEDLDNKPGFKALSDDFTQVRDLYTLETLRKSINIAVSADVSQKNGQLLITRALQIIGEHLKNTIDSPKLSNATYELLISALPGNVKEIITELRNCLSHAESLSSRSENEENVISFFASIQSDIAQLSTIIFDIFRRKNARIFGIMLSKINDCENSSSVKLFLKQNHFSLSAFEKEMKEIEETEASHIIGYIEEVERLVRTLEAEVEKELNSSKELFRRIHNVAYGKYFENGVDLSTSIDLQEYTLQSNIKEIIKVYRDSFLRTNLPISEFMSKDILQQFANLPMEAEKCCKVLNKLFVMKLISAIKSVILKIRSYEDCSGMEDLLTRIQELEEVNTNNEEEIKESEELILDLEAFSYSTLNSAKEMFRKIYWTIEKEKARLEKTLKHFYNALWKFTQIVREIYKDNGGTGFKKVMKSHISVIKATVLETSASNKMVFSEELSLAFKNLIQQLHDNCLKGDGFETALFNVYNFIEFRMGQIQGIKEFKQMLKPNKKHQRSKSLQNICKLKNADQLSLKLSSLKTIISNYRLETLATEQVHDCTKELNLQSLLEMVVLDVMSALECFPDRLAHNAYFLDADYPVVNGKNLRNHLAHGNALVSIILRNEFINVLLNAKKLIGTKDLLGTDRQIGKKIKNDPVKLKASHDEDLANVKHQYDLFLTLTEGSIEEVKTCIRKGADMYGRDLNSRTSLHFAAKGPNLEMVKFVLKFSNDINIQDDKGQTALHTAASNGRLCTVEYLLQDMKMPTDRTDISQKTPLHYACENGHLDVVKCLLKRNAKTISKDIFDYAPLHYAVERNYINIVSLLLEKESNADDNKLLNGISVLHLAAETGNLDLVALLIDKNADVNCRTDMHFVPLHFAARKGHVEIIKLLIAKGANVNSRNVFMETPLHVAVENGFAESVNVLLNHGADSNAVDSSNLTPLAIAARDGYLPIAELLLEKGVVLDILRECSQHPLNIAARFGQYELVKILMNKFDSNAMNSALTEAALCGHRRIAELLVNEGVNINAKWISSEFSALLLAAFQGHTDIVEFLIAQGCDVNTKAGGGNLERILNSKEQRYPDKIDSPIYSISKRDILAGSGQTALHLSSSRGHRDTVRTLLKNKANMHIKDDFGRTALFSIIQNGMTDILIEEGVAVGLMNCGIYTPLHLSCINGDLKFVQYCIQEGCNIEARSQLNSYTALHLAVKNDHAEIVNYLLDSGSNINAKTDNGSTALSIAIEGNKKNILEILMDKNSEFTAEEERRFMLIAAKRGNEDIVEYLLFKNSKNGASNFKYDHYPLHTAVQYGHLNTVKKLTEVLDRSEIDAKNKDSTTPLYIAADHDHCEIAKFLLLKGADPNVKICAGIVPLHAAARKGNSEMFKILLKGGADSFITDAQGRSCIEFAISFGHLDIVEILVNHSKIDVNLKSNKDYSLLHLAVKSGSLEIVQFLVDLKADINAIDSTDEKPVHTATMEGYQNIVEYFLNIKFDINDRGVNGWTLLHYAAAGNHINICNFLLEKGLDVNVEDAYGCTPLHVATERGNTKVFQFLLRNGACYDIRNTRNETPLQVASWQNNSIILALTVISNLFSAVKSNDYTKTEVLLKESEEFLKIDYANLKNEKGLFLLHYAAWKGNKEITEILLKFKANPNGRSRDGCMPLHYASKLSHFVIVKTLLRYGAIFEAQNAAKKTALNYATDENVIQLLNFLKTIFSKVRSAESSVMDDLESITDLNVSNILMRTKNIQGRKLTTMAVLYNHPKVEKIKELFQNDVFVPLKMAEFFFEHGQYVNSIKHYDVVLQKRIDLFGRSDPTVLDIQFKLCLIRFRQGYCYEALNLVESVYLKRKEIYGESHKETLEAHGLLETIKERIRKKHESMDGYEDALNRLNKALDPGHVETLEDRIYWENLLLEVNEAEMTAKVFGEVMETLVENFDGALFMLWTFLRLGKILRLMDMHSKALEIFHDVFEMQKKCFGLHDYETLKTMSYIAETFLLIGEEETSLGSFQTVLDLQCSVLGSHHVDTLHSRNCIAHILFSKRKFCEALEIYQSDFEKRIEVLGANDPEILMTRKRLDFITAYTSYDLLNF